MNASAIPVDLPEYVSLVLEALRKMVAFHAGRNQSVAPVVRLLWSYLNRVARRFEALVLEVRAGKARAGKARAGKLRAGKVGLGKATVAAPAEPRPAPDAQPPRKPQLPTGFGWLIRLAPEVRMLRSQIRHFLEDPELADLLATDPRFGKILRRLCQMMGISARSDPDLPKALFQPPAPGAPGPENQVAENHAPPSPDPLPRTPRLFRFASN